MRFINIVCLVAIATITGCAPSIIKTRDAFPESECSGLTDPSGFHECIQSALRGRAKEILNDNPYTDECRILFKETPPSTVLSTGKTIGDLYGFECGSDRELREFGSRRRSEIEEAKRQEESRKWEAEQQAREAAAAEKEQAMTEARQAVYRVIPIETAQLTVIDVIRQYRGGDFAGLVKRIDRCWASAKADKDMMMCGVIGMTAAVSHEVYKVRNRPLALSPEFVMTDMRKRLISKGKARNDEEAEAYMDAKIRPFADLILVTIMM